MEIKNYNLSDDQFIKIVEDFVRTQEKLQAERQQALDMGEMSHFAHYTSAETTLKNFRELMIG